jgi:hypothetical protein
MFIANSFLLDVPELFHVIFNATHDKYQVLDSAHIVVAGGPLTHT